MIGKALETRPVGDSRPVVLVAEDEARFGRINEPVRCRTPPGVKPHAPRQVVHEYLYAFCAVSPSLGRMAALLLPYSDTEMMNLFLQEVSRTFKESFVLMLLDQAGWHTAKGLKIPENIRLIPLPPRSPELNPTERIREDIRQKELANQAFLSMDELEDCLCRSLERLMMDRAYLSSLTSYPYLVNIIL